MELMFTPKIEIEEQLEMELKIPEKLTEKKDIPYRMNYKLKPSEMVAYLDQHVIGQEQAKKELSVALCNHIVLLHNNLNTDSTVKIKKNNLMLVGPTGSGKTFMLDKVCRYLGLPFITVDINQFSAAGYKGRDVEDIFKDIIYEVDGDERKIPYSVIFIDEMDKQASNTSGDNAFYDKKVQYDLLKIIEGYEYAGMDLSNILFVFGGSFDKIRMAEEAESKKVAIGFSRNEPEKKIATNRPITQDDMVSAGLIREIVGRIGQIIQLEPLSEEQYESIVMDVSNSIKEQYDQIFRLRGIRKEVTREDAKEIARKASLQSFGARALSTVAVQHFQSFLYE